MIEVFANVNTVWHGTMLPYQNFPEVGGRFVSEFGMEAFPHRATVEKFIEDEDEMHPQSLTMDFHNKARDHGRRLGTYILENFRVKSDLQVGKGKFSTSILSRELQNANSTCFISHTCISLKLYNPTL